MGNQVDKLLFYQRFLVCAFLLLNSAPCWTAAEIRFPLDKPEDALLEEIVSHLQKIRDSSSKILQDSWQDSSGDSRFLQLPASDQSDPAAAHQANGLGHQETKKLHKKVAQEVDTSAVNVSAVADHLSVATIASDPADVTRKSIPSQNYYPDTAEINKKPLLLYPRLGYLIIFGSMAAAASVLLPCIIYIRRWTLEKKLAEEHDYPAYGITGPAESREASGRLRKSASFPRVQSPRLALDGDKRLAHSAHMFRFHHHKQQVIAMQKSAIYDCNANASGDESENESQDGDYTVYECPGLAPTGEMEVKNPLFADEPTPNIHENCP